jgi:hypothetical protein
VFAHKKEKYNVQVLERASASASGPAGDVVRDATDG